MDTIVRTQHGDERFRALFEHAPVGVALCDPNGRFTDVNDTVREILGGTGIDPDDATLLDLLRYTPREADEHEQWPMALEAVCTGEQPVARVQLALAPPGDVPRFVQVTAARVALGEQTYLMTHLEDATGRRMEEQRLIYLATHDALTGLPNRELVQQRLVAALTRAAVSALPVGVLYLDLDHFKDVNDRLGHHVGDALLAAVGERLGTVLRAGDSAGRLSGDEFLIVASDVAGDRALAELVKRIDATLSAPVAVGGAAMSPGVANVPLAVSVGAVLSRPGEQPAALIRRADAAMYAAKRARRRQAARVGAGARKTAAGATVPSARTPRTTGTVVRAQKQMVCEQAAVAEQR